MDDLELIPIGQAAEILGVSITTLRRWDESGRLTSVRSGPTGRRNYSKRDIEIFLNDLLKLAVDWVYNETDIPGTYYCANSAVFQARLIKMQERLSLSKEEELQKIFPLIVAVAGEIGNNSFDHNLGNWPDAPGIFFGYDLNKRQVILADRGQGILKTLKRARPELANDSDALIVAFTEFVSGRTPEDRGNGLKFVKDVVERNLQSLTFQTGDAELKLSKGSNELKIGKNEKSFHGCIALITF